MSDAKNQYELTIKNIGYMRDTLTSIEQSLSRMESNLQDDSMFFTGNELTDVNRGYRKAFVHLANADETIHKATTEG